MFNDTESKIINPIESGQAIVKRPIFYTKFDHIF